MSDRMRSRNCGAWGDNHAGPDVNVWVGHIRGSCAIERHQDWDRENSGKRASSPPTGLLPTIMTRDTVRFSEPIAIS